MTPASENEVSADTPVFVSYAREDRTRAAALVRALEGCGFAVWWDSKIPLGVTFDEEIDSALEKARCVIVLWTTRSVTSRWVKSEARAALDRGTLLPVLLEAVRPPLGFRELETAQLIGWGGEPDHPELHKLLRHVASLAGPTTMAGPSPSAPNASPQPPVQAGARPDRRLRSVAVAIASIGLIAIGIYALVAGGERKQSGVQPASQLTGPGSEAPMVQVGTLRGRIVETPPASDAAKPFEKMGNIAESMKKAVAEVPRDRIVPSVVPGNEATSKASPPTSRP
jgi:hypothetical protein